MAQIGHMPHVVRWDWRAIEHTPGLQAFWALRAAFTIAPIIAGLDKFADLLTQWTKYLAPWARNLTTSAFGSAGPQWFMYGVGVIEVIAGFGVLIYPRIFGYVVSAWLLAIVVNLLTFPPETAFYDIALRDIGLAVGAFACAKLAAHYDRNDTEARA
jgi:hypothetical protein